MLYQPCLECLNKYGHSYTKECDTTCAYAKEVSDLKQQLEVRTDALWKVIISNPDCNKNDSKEYWQCSNCSSNTVSPTNFCPNCGARMFVKMTHTCPHNIPNVIPTIEELLKGGAE